MRSCCDFTRPPGLTPWSSKTQRRSPCIPQADGRDRWRCVAVQQVRGASRARVEGTFADPACSVAWSWGSCSTSAAFGAQEAVEQPVKADGASRRRDAWRTTCARRLVLALRRAPGARSSSAVLGGRRHGNGERTACPGIPAPLPLKATTVAVLLTC
jgi:hypothetical protein